MSLGAVHPGHRPLAGIGFMILATAIFSTMDATVKWLAAAGYPVPMIMFARAFFAFLPLVPLLYRFGPKAALKTQRPFAHLLRSGLGITAMGCYFYAYTGLPLAEVTAIGFAAPLMMAALSVPLLKEHVGPRRWAAVLVGFLGVLVMARPGSAVFSFEGAVALMGTLFYALVMIASRSLGRTESSITTVFWFTLAGTLALGGWLPWNWKTPDAADFFWLALVGIQGGIAQLAITQAVRLAPVSLVAPFDYLHLVFAAVLGFLVFGDLPAAETWIGAGILAVSGLYVLHRESLKRADGPDPAAAL